MLFAFALALSLQAAPKLPTPETLFTDKAPLVGMVPSLKGDQVFAQTWTTVTAIGREDGAEQWKADKIMLDGKTGPIKMEKDGAPKHLPHPMLAVSGKNLFLGSNVMMPSFQSYDIKTGDPKQSQGTADMNQRATSLVTNKKGDFVWYGIEDKGVSRQAVGDVNNWSRRSTDNGGVTCMALDKKEKIIALGGKDSSVRYVNFQSASVDKKKHHKTGMGSITAITFGGKGKSVLVGNGKGEVQVLNTSKGKKLLTLEGPESAVRWIRAQAKDKWAVVAYANGQIRFFELKKGAKVLEIEHAEAKRGIVGLALLDKDQTLLSAGGKTVLSWNLEGLLK